MTNNHKQLIIFAKSPINGQCKTRLISLLGEKASTDFYKSLLLHTVSTAIQLNDIDIALYCYPDTHHPFIQQLTNKNHIRLHKQNGKDLGQRMYNAMHDSLLKYNQCVLIGSDCPSITTDYIYQAFSALNSHKLTLGPAKDGGYVLIGATVIQAEVFNNTQWSTNSVLQQCKNNIEHLKLSYQLLATLCDIDTPDDYIHYKEHNTSLLTQPHIKDSQ